MIETLQILGFGLIGFVLGFIAARTVRKLRDVKVIPSRSGADGRYG